MSDPWKRIEVIAIMVFEAGFSPVIFQILTLQPICLLRIDLTGLIELVTFGFSCLMSTQKAL